VIADVRVSQPMIFSQVRTGSHACFSQIRLYAGRRADNSDTLPPRAAFQVAILVTATPVRRDCHQAIYFWYGGSLSNAGQLQPDKPGCRQYASQFAA